MINKEIKSIFENSSVINKTNNNDFEEFERRLNYILGMSQAKWDEITELYRKVIYYDLVEEPLEYLAQIIGSAN